MNKSTIIIVVALWLFCAGYFALSKAYSLPYASYAMVGSWIASLLLLVCIVIYLRKQKSK